MEFHINDNKLYDGFVENLAVNKTDQLFFNSGYKSTITISKVFKYAYDISIYSNSIDDFLNHEMVLFTALNNFFERKYTRLTIVINDTNYLSSSKFINELLYKYRKKIEIRTTEGKQMEILNNKEGSFIIGDKTMFIYRLGDRTECNFKSIHAESYHNKFVGIYNNTTRTNFSS